MKSINKLKDQARTCEQKEEWEKAAQLYLQAVRQAEAEGDIAGELGLYNRVGDLYLKLGKAAEAVSFYEQAADHYAADGLFNNAIALCNKALRHVPERLELYRKLGRLSASQGFLTDARRWFLEFAERKLKAGQLDDAFAALRELADLADDAEVRALLARQLHGHGRTAEAVVELGRAYASLKRAGDRAGADAIAAEVRALDPVAAGTLDEQVEAGLEEAGPYDGLPLLVEPEELELESAAGAAGLAHPEPLAAQEPVIPPAVVETPSQPAVAQPPVGEASALPASMAEAAPPELPESTPADVVAPPEGFDPTAIGSVSLDGLETLVGGLVEVAETGQAEEQTEEQAQEQAEEQPPPALPLLGLEETAIHSGADLEFDYMPPPEPLPLLDLGPAAELVEEVEAEGPPEPRVELPVEQEEEAEEEEAEEEQQPLPPLPMLDEETAFAPLEEAPSAFPPPLPMLWDVEEEEEEEPAEPLPFLEESPPEPAALEPSLADAIPQPLPWLEEIPPAPEPSQAPSPESSPVLDETPAAPPARPEPAPLFEEGELEEALPFFEQPPLGEPLPEPAPAAATAPAEPWMPGSEPWAPSPEDALAEVLALYAQGERTTARVQMERLIASAQALHDDSRALQLLDACADAEPDDVEVLTRRAECATRVRGLRGAVDTLIALAAAHARLGNRAKASVVYEQVLDIDPSNATAGTALRKEREARPRKQDQGGFVDLGAMLLEDEDFQETTRFVVQGEQPSGDEEQDFVAMLEQFKEKVSEQMGEDPVAHYDLGLAYKDMGLVDEAIREFQVALRAGQDRLKVLEELGRCFLLKDQPSVALRLLQQALQVTGRTEMEYMGVYYLLGRSQEQLGHVDAARDAYERVVGLDLQFDDVAERLARL